MIQVDSVTRVEDEDCIASGCILGIDDAGCEYGIVIRHEVVGFFPLETECENRQLFCLASTEAATPGHVQKIVLYDTDRVPSEFIFGEG